MSESKSIVQQAIDVLIYVPVGLAVSAVEELPQLIDKGRSRVGPDISNARVLGRFAVTRSQREAEKLLGHAADWVTGAPPPPQARGDEPGARRRPAGAGQRVSSPPGGAGRETRPPGTERRPDLAIPGYDSLSASQVVQRLAGLSAHELDDVSAYEASHRHRKTVLNRAAQLRAADGS